MFYHLNLVSIVIDVILKIFSFLLYGGIINSFFKDLSYNVFGGWTSVVIRIYCFRGSFRVRKIGFLFLFPPPDCRPLERPLWEGRGRFVVVYLVWGSRVSHSFLQLEGGVEGRVIFGDT